MNVDFIKILNIDVISEALSLDDLKGGLASEQEQCCGSNSACNENDSGVCCDSNSACNINH